MATTHNAVIIDGIANGTISKGQFCKYASGGWVACSAITDIAEGVAFTDATAGNAVAMQVGGKVKYLAGAAISDGALIAPKADGSGQTAVSTQYARLKACGAGVSTGYAEAYWYSANVVTP
jgi:hypothetical protein